jgi:hypothetical protein
MTFALEPCAERGLDHARLGMGLTPTDLAGGRCKLQRIGQLAGNARGYLHQIGRGRGLRHRLPTYRKCVQAVDIATELRW